MMRMVLKTLTKTVIKKYGGEDGDKYNDDSKENVDEED